MRKIHFTYLQNENSKEVLDYLVDNCPDKLKIFAFDAYTTFGSVEYYIEGIKKVNIWYIGVLLKRFWFNFNFQNKLNSFINKLARRLILPQVGSQHMNATWVESCS